MPSLLLVHGAWHGAWCWDPVLRRLTARGIRPVAVDLPGHGNDPGPLGDLHDDAARVRDVLESLPAPVVLVGHSYGGAVITEAGHHPAVTHLVYLCAMALDRGESCATAAAEDPSLGVLRHEGRPDIGAGLTRDAQDRIHLDPETAKVCLYADCDPATADWAAHRLGPQSLISLQQTPSAVAWRTKPSTYVVGSADLAVHPALQRILAKRCTNVLEWDCGHSPFLSRPDQVADLLAGFA